MKYHFVLHEDSDGLWAECVEMDSVVSQGNDLPELETNLKEALEGVLASVLDRNAVHPLPDTSLDGREDLLQVAISSDIAFRIALRSYRLMHEYTQAAMQEMLGFRSRNSYVKLEREGNPTLRTTGKLVEVFPDFPIMECFP